MARLILEEGGERRAFRVKQGKLTIGSAEGCTLQLSSFGIEEHHADLVIREGKAILVTAEGADLPVINGRQGKAKQQLPAKCTFEIGDAVFHYEDESAEPQAAAPARKKVGARSGGKPDKGEVVRSYDPHKVRRGLPTWAILIIFVAGAGIAVFSVMAWFGSWDESIASPSERFSEAQRYWEERSVGDAEASLDKFFKVQGKASPELIAQAEALRKEITDAREAALLSTYNAGGTRYLDKQLKGFAEKRMKGRNATRERARVFIKRCRYFKKKWPQHPELDWVDRFETRYEGIAKMEEPSNFKDVSYEIETLTWAMPRDYTQSFRLLKDYRKRVGMEDEQAKALYDDLVRKRRDYFDDRMQQVKYHWKKNEKSTAVSWLAEVIIGIGDTGMENQAAEKFLALPGDWLTGFKTNKPEKFERLIENEALRNRAREQGLLDEE